MDHGLLEYRTTMYSSSPCMDTYLLEYFALNNGKKGQRQNKTHCTYIISLIISDYG